MTSGAYPHGPWPRRLEIVMARVTASRFTCKRSERASRRHTLTHATSTQCMQRTTSGFAVASAAMDYVHLGRTGLKVSRLCLGTMNFGPQTSEADSFKIMDRALDTGINFFDTANVYGWK